MTAIYAVINWLPTLWAIRRSVKWEIEAHRLGLFANKPLSYYAKSAKV